MFGEPVLASGPGAASWQMELRAYGDAELTFQQWMQKTSREDQVRINCTAILSDHPSHQHAKWCITLPSPCITCNAIPACLSCTSCYRAGPGACCMHMTTVRSLQPPVCCQRCTLHRPLLMHHKHCFLGITNVAFSHCMHAFASSMCMRHHTPPECSGDAAPSCVLGAEAMHHNQLHIP